MLPSVDNSTEIDLLKVYGTRFKKSKEGTKKRS